MKKINNVWEWVERLDMQADKRGVRCLLSLYDGDNVRHIIFDRLTQVISFVLSHPGFHYNMTAIKEIPDEINFFVN